MLVALLFYGYATGVFSSRKLAQATYDSIAFRYICANTHPDHRTIADFRKRFLDELAALFTQVLLVAQAMGLLKLGTVSLDGTKLKANASKHKALSFEHASRLEAQLKGEVEELLRLAKQADNAQAGVDTDTHLIVEQHVTDHSNDKQELAPALKRLDALPEVLGEVDALLADTGDHGEANLDRCATAGIDSYIPEARQRHNPPLAKRLADDPPAPAGQPPPAEANAQRLRARAGKARYAKRKATAETVFGIIKHVQGFRQFLLRGLRAVQGEWALVCLGWNLKRLFALKI